MSVWVKAADQLPPLGEEVLILYKNKDSRLAYDNMYYGIARRCISRLFPSSKGVETWSTYTDYQSHYEVVYWAKLYDMPHIGRRKK